MNNLPNNNTPGLPEDKPAMRKSRIAGWYPLIASLLIAGGLWIGVIIGRNHPPTNSTAKLNEILRLIESEYVDEVNMDSLIEKTLPYLLQNLDPHSAYISAAEQEAATQELEGSFCGIGIRFMMLNDTVVIEEVFANGPSERVGLQAGDRIIAVDGKDITGGDITLEDVPTLLRGPRDSQVNVTVFRPSSDERLDKTIIRADIPVTSIDASFMVNDSVGYVKVNKFARNTHQEFLQSLITLTRKGAKEFIIDMRGNRGGLFESAILMANEFLPGGLKIVETRGRGKDNNSLIISDGTGMYLNAPVTVLIDEFTASSSEIFAAALQDNDRGLIVGRRSFGKGLVQKPILLPDSSEIRLTVQRYYTPAGRSIQKDYAPGQTLDYEAEILKRYDNGEVFGAEDQVTVTNDQIYHTINGREVHGGGGVTPDIYVPADTLGMSSYYRDVVNKGLIQKYAFEMADLNRADFSKAKNVTELMDKLPGNGTLLRSFVQYATQNGVPARWYYINKSSLRIVNNLKAWIANDILGTSAFYEVLSMEDPAYLKAVDLIKKGITPDSLIEESIRKANDNK